MKTTHLTTYNTSYVYIFKLSYTSKAGWSELRCFFLLILPGMSQPLSLTHLLQLKSSQECILLGMNLFIPFTHTTGANSSPSWFNHQCATAVQGKNRLFHAWRLSLSESSWQAYITARNRCHTLIDDAKNSFILHMANKWTVCPTGRRSFWSLAKSVSKNFCTKFPPLETADGTLASDALSKANIFAKLFSSN